MDVGLLSDNEFDKISSIEWETGMPPFWLATKERGFYAPKNLISL